MANFRPLPEHELDRLDDDQLIDYIRKARAARDGDAVTLALRILVFGYRDTVEKRVALKVPTEEVQQVADEALESAFKSAFDGESFGEFASWVHRITARRIADYWRRREGKPKLVPLPEEHEEEDEIWGEIAGVEFEGTAIDAQRAIETAYGELNPQHQRVVDLYVFGDMSAADVSAETTESEPNVHQIASRFRKRVRELLDDGDTSA